MSELFWNKFGWHLESTALYSYKYFSQKYPRIVSFKQNKNIRQLWTNTNDHTQNCFGVSDRRTPENLGREILVVMQQHESILLQIQKVTLRFLQMVAVLLIPIWNTPRPFEINPEHLKYIPTNVSNIPDLCTLHNCKIKQKVWWPLGWCPIQQCGINRTYGTFYHKRL